MDALSALGDEYSRQQRGSPRPRLGVWTIIATGAPGLVVFALPTISLIARNPEFFRGDFYAGRDLYIVAVLVMATGFTLWAAAGRWRVARFLWVCYLLLTPGWLVYTLLGGWDRSVGGILVLTLILATSWYLNGQGHFASMRNLGLLSVLLLLSFVITTLFDLGGSSADGDAPLDMDKPDTTATVGDTGQVPNIYHVVLDEYQTQMFESTRDSELSQRLSGFTYFPETRTSYGRTEMSMASIFGMSDYDYQETPQEFADASLRGPESGFQELRQLGYQITGFTHLRSLYGTPSPFDETVLLRDYVEFDPGDDYIALANSLWLYAHTPAVVSRRLLPESHYSALTGGNLLPNEAPPVSVLSLEKFISRESELPSSGRYTLIHVILPHFPYVMSADCEYEEGVETGPSQQAACATRLVVELVEELKDLNRFEASVIIAHGDHGARFEMIGDSLHQIPQDFASADWNDARSRSLLLIKPAEIAADERLVVSEYPALLTDIIPTVFDSIGAPYVSTNGRVSLLGDDLPERTTRYYHFYDKGDDGLPDGELARYVIEGNEFRFDAKIELPD